MSRRSNIVRFPKTKSRVAIQRSSLAADQMEAEIVRRAKEMIADATLRHREKRRAQPKCWDWILQGLRNATIVSFQDADENDGLYVLTLRQLPFQLDLPLAGGVGLDASALPSISPNELFG